MSLATNYFLLGKFFTRKFSLSSTGTVNRDSIQQFRISEHLQNWYINYVSRNLTDNRVTVISRVPTDIINTNLQLIYNYFNKDVELYCFDFEYVNKFTAISHDAQQLKVEQKLLNKRNSKVINKSGITPEILLDSMSSHPVLPEDNFSDSINNHIFSSLVPRINNKTEITILSGEMLWSGWLSMNTLLSNLTEGKTLDTLFIIDSWGILQQLLSFEDFGKSLENIGFDDLLDSYTLSILFSKNILKKHPRSFNNELSKMSDYPLLPNTEVIKSYTENVSHKPDYLYDTKVDSSKIKSKNVYPLGIGEVQTFTTPRSFLGKKTFSISIPRDAVIQKYPGEKVHLNEDIGIFPTFNLYNLRIKLPKQINFCVNDFDFVSKGDKIGTRSVLKKMIKERILSPYEGFLNMQFKEIGIVQYKKVNSKVPFLSFFEGEFTKIEKQQNYQEVHFNSYSFYANFKYIIGDDISGRLMRLSEINNSEDDKILLLKSTELNQINPEFLLVNNIKGLILDTVDYKKLRTFVTKTLKNFKLVTICILGEFSNKKNDPILDIFYMYTQNYVVIHDNMVNLLISNSQLKEILLRLKSKDNRVKSNQLERGDSVRIFNYTHQDQYARIEKVSKESVILGTNGDIITTKLLNISKFTNIQLDAEHK
jgi:hypothetical protein